MATKNPNRPVDPNYKPPSDPSNRPQGPDPYLSQFSDQAYANTPGFQSLIQGFVDQRTASVDQRDWTPEQVKNMVSGYAQTFHDMYVNKVGAEPTPEDYSTFFQSYLTPDEPWMQQIPAGQYTSEVNTGIANLFSGKAQDVAQKKAQDLATKETAAGSPFDVWQGSYKKSISDTESQLQDFQSRLFEKLRPQLITSLQSQGLLNTGALNESLAGAAGDLTSEAQRYLAGVKTQSDQQIADRKFAISQAPNDFALSNLFSTPGNISQTGQDALTNLWNNEMQQNAINARNYRAGLASSDQPSMIDRYAGLITGGAAAGFGSKLGSRIPVG